MLYLFECSLGIEQVEDHIRRHTDEWRHPDAVAQDSGPWREVVVEQPDLWREGQETDDDELHTGREHKQRSDVTRIKHQGKYELLFICICNM